MIYLDDLLAAGCEVLLQEGPTDKKVGKMYLSCQATTFFFSAAPTYSTPRR
jgi:hypothetical protein